MVKGLSNTGRPTRWDNSQRTGISCLPPAVNSGQYLATWASRSSSPRWRRANGARSRLNLHFQGGPGKTRYFTEEIVFHLDTHRAIGMACAAPIRHHHRIQTASTGDHNQYVFRLGKSAVFFARKSGSKLTAVMVMISGGQMRKLPQPLCNRIPAHVCPCQYTSVFRSQNDKGRSPT